MKQRFTVSKAAQQLGLFEKWLREAEKRGSIPKARRYLNGWRIYTEEDIKRLKALLIPENQVLIKSENPDL